MSTLRRVIRSSGLVEVNKGKVWVVNADIPCLISKASMKHAKMVINTFDDTATIYDTVVKLRAMKSGHYFVKLDDYVYVDLNDDLKHENVMIELNDDDDDI